MDNGNVSFSNPVRQSLFNFKDCLEGGARKATRAAQALSEIYPGVETTGHVLSVPMAGHPITDTEKTRKEFGILKALVDDHDVIFLLMDTRESRWLPTVIGKAAGKIVINAAPPNRRKLSNHPRLKMLSRLMRPVLRSLCR